MQNTNLNLYPTTSSSTAEKSTFDLQQQLYLKMKTKPQDQSADPKLWEILKAKFEKPQLFAYHDEHHMNADPPEGEKQNMAKRYFSNQKQMKMGIFCEWKTNSIDDEAFVIINP
uniref:Uncharacterized protein n=1 Tax=Tanacetum cinerariifolium TaxID=118510 RepID=A0A699I5G5_TANCI|nr:hypothetical protein [Tanacetum cinerariifolium]